MNVYAIANIETICCGHGDFRPEEKIIKDYRTDKFPPVFTTRKKAYQWINKHRPLDKSNLTVVSLKLEVR